ncbi:MAG: hypothetical protein K2L76_08615 [Muribaculaceae bacterium]|nr:hypothetical protein [Muribaculaceae bacterium]
MMNKPIKSLTCAAACGLLMTSCASLFTKSSQEISFRGVPGTTVVDTDKNKIIAEVGSNGFATATVRKQLGTKHLGARKDGYRPQDYELGTKIQGWFWGNILLGGIPGMAIDAATGKMKKYKTDMLDVTLQPLDETVAEEEVAVIPMASPNAVSRRDAGATEFERVILRWFIDSDPRGARLFYRVISNVPSEVKNTNETYLTTTPLEETRSFNIIGLTPENASNVTIEIKVTKRGYEDQVKRYNVRQAIDQQEISGFFELVPKDN